MRASELNGTDYLIIGSGASGLAFADSLVKEQEDVEVTLVDTRDAPGGHWRDAYPFVRLHSPSAYYGVNSLPLGKDQVDETGENAGFYERATGAAVRQYFDEAAAALTRTGRVRILTRHEHLGTGTEGELVRDLETGGLHEIGVRRKLVDARYLEASIPATHTPSFEVAPSARVVPVNALPEVAEPGLRYTVLGSGKTAVDACIWLVDNGVEPDRIRWVRPREAWFHRRAHFQPLDQVGGVMAGMALDAEAGAAAEDVEDLFDRLEDSGRLFRIDPSASATMYRGTMLSPSELDVLRQISDVVRLGRVRRIEPDRIVLESGEISTRADVVHVDCTAAGLGDAPARPVFSPKRIVIQEVRQNSPTFSAAFIGFVEARRTDDAEKNELCPPNPHASAIHDWPRMTSRTLRTEMGWSSETDVMEWVSESRLNLLRALPDQAAEPSVKQEVGRFVSSVGDAVERLGRL